MPKLKRGEVWSVDLEPQAHRSEPGKRGRPALVLQCDALNDAGHLTTLVVPGTTNIQTGTPQDAYPLRVRIQKNGNLTSDTDLMIDQVRAIANARFIERMCVISPAHMQRVRQALDLLIR